MLLTDKKTNTYGLSRADLGWRVDCLGDMGGFTPTWSHMNDYYPQAIISMLGNAALERYGMGC